MLEATDETDLPPAAEEMADVEEKYDLSPPKALFQPSPNHPLHILVSIYAICCLAVILSLCIGLWS